MELTAKGVATVLIPAIVMVAGNFVDNSLKWRAELEQKKHDRQIRILDKILETPQAEHRIASAEFYLKTNTFSGQYKNELEISVMLAKEFLAKQAAKKTSTKQLTAPTSTPKPLPSLVSSSGYLPIKTIIKPPTVKNKNIFTYSQPLP